MPTIARTSLFQYKPSREVAPSDIRVHIKTVEACIHFCDTEVAVNAGPSTMWDGPVHPKWEQTRRRFHLTVPYLVLVSRRGKITPLLGVLAIQSPVQYCTLSPVCSVGRWLSVHETAISRIAVTITSTIRAPVSQNQSAFKQVDALVTVNPDIILLYRVRLLPPPQNYLLCFLQFG